MPKRLLGKLDQKLSDHSNTYVELTNWLNKELKKAKVMVDGEQLQISKSGLGRYAFRTKKMAERYAESMLMVREIVKMGQENPEENLGEGALQLAMMALTERLTTVTFEGTSDAKVVELTAEINRTKAYKDKVYANIKKDIEKGYDQFLTCLTDFLTSKSEAAKQKAGKVLLKRYGIQADQLDIGNEASSKRVLAIFTEFKKVITNPVPRHEVN